MIVYDFIMFVDIYSWILKFESSVKSYVVKTKPGCNCSFVEFESSVKLYVVKTIIFILAFWTEFGSSVKSYLINLLR